MKSFLVASLLLACVVSLLGCYTVTREHIEIRRVSLEARVEILKSSFELRDIQVPTARSTPGEMAGITFRYVKKVTTQKTTREKVWYKLRVTKTNKRGDIVSEKESRLKPEVEEKAMLPVPRDTPVADAEIAVSINHIKDPISLVTNANGYITYNVLMYMIEHQNDSAAFTFTFTAKEYPDALRNVTYTKDMMKRFRNWIAENGLN